MFFVLSGYLVGGQVLQYVRQGRFTWRVYMVKRFTRLWDVPIPARPEAATLKLARHVTLYQSVRLFIDSPEAVIEIGNDTHLNRRAEITCKDRVTIGEGFAISWDVLITDTDYHQISGSGSVVPVKIGNRSGSGPRR